METIMVPMRLPRWLSYKESASKQVMGVWSLGQEDFLEKKVAKHSSFLIWKIQWMEKQGGLQSMVLQKSWT